MCCKRASTIRYTLECIAPANPALYSHFFLNMQFQIALMDWYIGRPTMQSLLGKKRWSWLLWWYACISLPFIMRTTVSLQLHRLSLWGWFCPSLSQHCLNLCLGRDLKQHQNFSSWRHFAEKIGCPHTCLLYTRRMGVKELNTWVGWSQSLDNSSASSLAPCFSILKIKAETSTMNLSCFGHPVWNFTTQWLWSLHETMRCENGIPSARLWWWWERLAWAWRWTISPMGPCPQGLLMGEHGTAATNEDNDANGKNMGIGQGKEDI